MDSAHVSEMLHSRHITFAGKFEPVQHQCRAMKPNGRLCERQDRLKVRLVGKAIGTKLWLPRRGWATTHGLGKCLSSLPPFWTRDT